MQLFRQLNLDAARRGRTIRDLVDQGVRALLGQPPKPSSKTIADRGAWRGALREFAPNAKGEHDLQTMRRNIAAERTSKPV